MEVFTLMELMITVVIVAILAATSVASYSSYAMRSKRTDARAALATTSTSLEKCKAIYGVYNNANCSIGDGDSVDSSDRFYTVGVATTATTFTLTATPVAGTSQEGDTDCTSLILDHLGVQTATGDTPLDCW